MLTQHRLNYDVTLMSERHIRYLIKREMRTLKRRKIVVRLHQRLNTLRVKRERAALMERLTHTD